MIANGVRIMMHGMRTTVTLDPETERLLKESMRRHGCTFKEALDRAVLRGLSEPEDHQEGPCEPPTARMGLRAGHDAAAMNRLPDDLEAEAFVALTRRLERGPG